MTVISRWYCPTIPLIPNGYCARVSPGEENEMI